jgi:hypothetical protein
MHLLKEKYKLPIEYYPIDTVLAKEAMQHHKSHKNTKESEGSGGCSYYIYKWVEKHLG